MAKFDNGDDYTKAQITNIKKAAKQVGQQMTLDLGMSMQEALKEEEDIEVTTKDSTVSVKYEKETTTDDVVDMKKFFKRSPKRKDTIDGGWHMVIPIRRYTGRQKETREKASGMSSRLYTDLLNKPAAAGYTDLMSRYLYDNRGPGSSIRELNYVPKSQTITRMPNPTGAGHTYVSFRTVSDKSHPASWVLNRSSADSENRTAEVNEIVDKVKKFNFG